MQEHLLFILLIFIQKKDDLHLVVAVIETAERRLVTGNICGTLGKRGAR
jgi:hypothetical protein